MDFNTLDKPSPFADYWHPGGHGHSFGGDASSIISNLATQALHAKGHQEPEDEAEGSVLAQNPTAKQESLPQHSPAGPGVSFPYQQGQQQMSESDAGPLFHPESPLNGKSSPAYEESTARTGGEFSPGLPLQEPASPREPDQNSADAETGAAGEDVTDGNTIEENPGDSNAPESNEPNSVGNPQPVALQPTPPSSETHSANSIEPAHEDREQMEADADFEPQEDAPPADDDGQANSDALDTAESVVRLPSMSSPAGEPEPDVTAQEEPSSEAQIHEQITENTADESHESRQPAKRHRRSGVELLEAASNTFLKGDSIDRRSRRVSAPETLVLEKKTNARSGKGSLLPAQAATQTPGRRGRPRKSETPRVPFASVLKQRVKKTPTRSTPVRAKFDVTRSARTEKSERVDRNQASGSESTPVVIKRGRPPKGQVTESTPASIKRGRGRPPNGEAKEPTDTPNRRGRPSKSAAPPSAAKATTPALPKKSPGKPKKPVTTPSEALAKRSGRNVGAMTPTPNKRGRPARQVAAPAPKQVTFSEVKRRGRPPRNATTTTVDSPKPAKPSTQLESKKRGRRSQPNEKEAQPAPTEPKRTRGGLAKPTVEKTASQPTDKGTTPAKKRGRPAKATTVDEPKPTKDESSAPTRSRRGHSKPAVVERIASQLAKEESNSIPAKKRGRAKTTAVSDTTQSAGDSGSTTAKKRGRSAKLTAVEKIASQPTENKTDSTSVKRGSRSKSTSKITSKPTEKEVDPTPARKRGRPPKSTAIPKVPVSTEPPKKRGRASRVEVETPEEPGAKRRRTRTSAAGNDISNETESAVTGAPSSGRRGRSQKSDTSLTTAAAPPAQSSATTSRGRGRKPAGEAKSSSAAVQPSPRPRGRPAKSSGAGEVETPKVDSGAKPRGRPRRDATAQGALAKAAGPKGIVKAKSPAKKGRAAAATRAASQPRRSLRSTA